MTIHPLSVTVHPTHSDLGAATAARAAEAINAAIAERGQARVMLAAAPSQSPTLTALAGRDVNFDKVTFFHMDDYLGLDDDAPQGFGNWLQTHFFAHVEAGPTFHRMDLHAPGEASASDYAALMGEEPFDVTLCGLGVNAHLAFNDPPADFAEPRSVRLVALDTTSRQQQVDEGHFPTLDNVSGPGTHGDHPAAAERRRRDLLGSRRGQAGRRRQDDRARPDARGSRHRAEAAPRRRTARRPGSGRRGVRGGVRR
ncbi:6-phosphogluconolactonase [Propioniciclava flava]